jgi:hypothetical protein
MINSIHCEPVEQWKVGTPLKSIFALIFASFLRLLASDFFPKLTKKVKSQDSCCKQTENAEE